MNILIYICQSYEDMYDCAIREPELILVWIVLWLFVHGFVWNLIAEPAALIAAIIVNIPLYPIAILVGVAVFSVPALLLYAIVFYVIPAIPSILLGLFKALLGLFYAEPLLTTLLFVIITQACLADDR